MASTATSGRPPERRTVLVGPRGRRQRPGVRSATPSPVVPEGATARGLYGSLIFELPGLVAARETLIVWEVCAEVSPLQDYGGTDRASEEGR
jgi:hypothetical protein